MNVDEALAIVDRATTRGNVFMVAIDTAQTLADRVRATQDRDEWKGTAESRQAAVDALGRVVARLHRKLDDACAERDTMTEKARAWERSSTEQRRLEDEATKWQERAEAMRGDVENLTAELDRTQGHWSDLMAFIRAQLSVSDDRNLDDVTQVRQLLGAALKDARLLARVRDELNGHFVAGDMVTAENLNVLKDAVKAGRKTGMEPTQTTRVAHGKVWVAPMGTDPDDVDKWTAIGLAKDFTITTSFPKVTNLMGPVAPATFASPPVPRRFSKGADEPELTVTRVRWPDHITAAQFTRAGWLANGQSLWRDDEEGDDGVLWTWFQLVANHPAVEIL